MKYTYLYLLLFINFSIIAVFPTYHQQEDIKVYLPNKNAYSKWILNKLEGANISFQINTEINPRDNKLYLIFDHNKLQRKHFPQYYILILTQHENHSDYSDPLFIQKAKDAICVWDDCPENIKNYKDNIFNYRFVPIDYEYIDPIILPCFLSIESLPLYKQFLIYENSVNTDISSHLPTLLCYTLLEHPKLILELGIRGGESSKPFIEWIKKKKSSFLVGLDIDKRSERVYQGIDRTLFISMDDRDFLDYYNDSQLQKSKFDFIFIDTSHEYNHTLKEIEISTKLISDTGIISFHDSNVTPYSERWWKCLNGTIMGPTFGTNPRGVPKAIKDYFSINFDEYKYANFSFVKNGSSWHIIHYPFCNGLTLIKKMK